MHDHFGAFSTAAAGLHTPTLQMADNDYALGLLVESISKSPFWKDTAIFVLEDDSQDGPDHVDGHRSAGYILIRVHEARRAGPYDVDHGRHAPHDRGRSRRTVHADKRRKRTPYTAINPGSLCAPPAAPDLVPECEGTINRTNSKSRLRTQRGLSLRDVAWCSAMTAGMDFSKPDAIDSTKFDAILREGMTGENATAASGLLR